MALRGRFGPITIGKSGVRLSVGKGKHRVSVPLNRRDLFTGRKNRSIVKVGAGRGSGLSWWVPVGKWWRQLKEAVSQRDDDGDEAQWEERG